MPDRIQKEYQDILNQIHSNVFWERLKDHLDPVDRSDLIENDASNLNYLVRRLLVEDVSPSIDSEVIQKFLEDEDLSQATRSLIKFQSKEAEKES
jgi:hypothetical protein